VEENRRHAELAAPAPRERRVDLLFLLLWAVALASPSRWPIIFLTGG
jgi:hypothetical protein